MTGDCVPWVSRVCSVCTMDDSEIKWSCGRGQRKLNGPEWNALLSALDRIPERAAHKYETALSGLIRIFRSRGLWNDAEDLADETVDRVARRILEKAGTPEPIVNVLAYMRVVAGKVAGEVHRRPRHVSIEDVAEAALLAGALRQPSSEIDEHVVKCLRRLVDELPERDRRIIGEYYEYSRSEKIAHRQLLARETGLSAGALRVKACRIRRLLRERLRQELENEPGPAAKSGGDR